MVESLKEDFSNSSYIALVDYSGLNADAILKLRRDLKQKKVNVRISKNTLSRIAVEGTSFESLKDLFVGPIAISYGNDPVAISKVLVDFETENEALEIKAACLNGAVVTKADMVNLSKLGSLEEVRAGFVGTLNAAGSKLARLLNAPASGLAALFNNYASSK